MFSTKVPPSLRTAFRPKYYTGVNAVPTKTIDKLLIANRGEIACRVMKTAKTLGIKTVAVYSDADKDSMHVAMADEAYHIGPAPASESYLLGARILEVAKQSGAQAIHPGYGFLSENANFAKEVANNGLTFVGPPASAIESMGSKSASKNIMLNAGVPCVPGYHGDDQSTDRLIEEANKIGYPVLLKAWMGGGGKGMRIAYSKDDIFEAVESCKRESKKSFGDDRVLVEKYLQVPRHIEVQVFADFHGNCVYLFERDCSVQRRHQKIIEEAPAPGLSDEMRESIGRSAVDAARAVGYRGAGTVEFIVENDQFYFMEMNTRLQVEHPITEMITKQDLVAWQIAVAQGLPLPLKQEELKIHGHAFEARIYAENPRNDFLPGTGQLDFVSQPAPSEHVRVDTGVRQGDEVSIFYDPMIAKLVVWDVDRHAALRRLIANLSQYHIAPLQTNIEFLISLAEHPDFQAGHVHTGFIQQHHSALFAADSSAVPGWVQCIAALAAHLQEAERQREAQHASLDPCSPWAQADSYSTGTTWSAQTSYIGEDGVTYHVALAQKEGSYEVTVHSDKQPSHTFREVTAKLEGSLLTAHLDGRYIQAVVFEHEDAYHVMVDAARYKLEKVKAKFATAAVASGSLKAPMPGKIIKAFVSVGDSVKKGQPLLVLEAMKMEHQIKSPTDGVVKAIHFPMNSQVSQSSTLVTLE